MKLPKHIALSIEHIKKWYDGSQSLEELRHAIDHAISELEAAAP